MANFESLRAFWKFGFYTCSPLMSISVVWRLVLFFDHLFSWVFSTERCLLWVLETWFASILIHLQRVVFFVFGCNAKFAFQVSLFWNWVLSFDFHLFTDRMRSHLLLRWRNSWFITLRNWPLPRHTRLIYYRSHLFSNALFSKLSLQVKRIMRPRNLMSGWNSLFLSVLLSWWRFEEETILRCPTGWTIRSNLLIHVFSLLSNFGRLITTLSWAKTS